MRDFSKLYDGNTKHYALAVLGIAASTGLMFGRMPQYALPTAGFSLGYWAAIIANTGRTEKFIEQSLKQIRTEFQERIESLDSRLSKALRDASSLRNNKDTLEKNYANLKANTVILTTEYQDLKQNFNTRLAEEMAKYASEKDAEVSKILADKDTECLENIQDKEHEYVGKIREFAKQWDTVLKAKQTEVENKEAVIAEYQQIYQAAKESDSEIEQEFYNLERKIAQLQTLAGAKDEEIHRLSRASLKLDATFPSGTYAGDLGNQVLAFYRQRKFEIAPIEVTPKPSGVVEIVLQPFGSVQADFERYVEEFYYEFKPLSQPRFDKADGYLKMVIKSGINEKESKLKDAPSDYFEQALKRVFHIRVTGETDTGKSTLVNNVVGLILSQHPNCEVKLYNPLYGSKYDKWQIPATWRTYDQFPGVIQEIESEFDRRAKISAQAKDKGLGYPEFPVILYVLDECENSISLHPDCAKPLKRCLNHGRHQDLFVVYITQSPLASAVKLNRPDFNASIGFHLGRNALRVLKDLDFGSEMKENLTTQYELRMQRGDKFTVLCDVKNELFWAYPPAPDTYAIPASHTAQGKLAKSLDALLDKDTEPSGDAPNPTQNPAFSADQSLPQSAPKCPRCQSSNVRKKGKSGIKQRLECKDCKRSFTVDII
ncbi:MAG TPA: hypothetical protein DD990_15350 [Cyanobacteria bacterium UBA11368]|nr:hypothetical protein [Cyanobacteria bacterium UBA11368]